MKMGPQEDYIETVFTCKGDFNDPNLHLQLEEFYEGLRSLLLPESCSEKLILKKVEPWNSVRVTFNIPRAAALKLKQLAQQGDTNLRRLGVLAVQIEGDQSISLTIAGKNNERTELVFKTGSTDGSVEPSMSVLESAPSGSTVETTRKNIAEYLRQGALLDPLLSHLGGNNELLKSPNVVATSSGPIPFLSGGTTTMASTGKNPGLHNSPLHGLVFPPGRSPTGYPTSPSQGYLPVASGRNVVGSMSQSYSSYPHLHARQTIGNLLLPPPPPYPHPQVVSMNNFQKPNRPMTSSSPLLVNLLQNDPSGGLLHSLAQGKLPELLDGNLDALALAKKKRKKKRKKQRLAAEALAREAQMLLESVPNTSVVSTSALSLPGFKKSVKKSKHSLSSGLAADHSTNLPDSVRENASDKLVNPYTGLLEPADVSGDSTSGSSAIPDQPEKIDTIQAAINRVADAWTAHVPDAAEIASTDTSSVLTSSSSEVPTTAVSTMSSLVSFPSETSPVHSMPCSSSFYISPLSTAPSFGRSAVSDTLASSSVCDRPPHDPHHRPYDISYSQSNKNNTNSPIDSLHREPLLAMQHVTNSVGLPSGPRPAAPIPTPSHMQPQFSMQETFVPKPSQALSRATINTGEPLFSRSGGLPGGHSALSPAMPEKSKVFPTSAAGEMPQLPPRRHAGTPPYSILGSPPMTSQAERPRSTGSYPLSRAGDDKGLAEVVSKMLPHFQSGSTYVHPGNPGLHVHSIENEHARIQMQSLGSCLTKNPPRTTQGQNVPPFLQNVPPIENQFAFGNPKIEMPKKGTDEINNSNHDSGLSSQSEATDENQLTDETASSCGTQGSPPLTVSDGLIKTHHGRLQGKHESQVSAASMKPTSSQPLSSHHYALMSGNPVYNKNLCVQAMLNSAEAVTPHNPAAVSKNPTVLHWNTRDVQVSSGSHIPGSGNAFISAEKDSRQCEQHNVLLQKQCEKEQVHQSKCQSPDNRQTVPPVKDGLVAHSRESDMLSCRPDITRLSVNVSSMADVRETSHASVHRDKGIVTASPYRTPSYTPSAGSSSSYCGGETYGNYHKDIRRTVPIMSASVHQGHEGKTVGEPPEVKPHLQSSAIGVVPGLPDLRTAKLIDNASSACPESHTDAISKNVRLHRHPSQDAAVDSVSSSMHHMFKAHPEPAPRTAAVSLHSSIANLAYSYPSSVDTHSLNSHGVDSRATVASHLKESVASRTHNVSTASATVISENCRPSAANPTRGHGEALNYNQHYANPLNIQMCNTTSSVSTAPNLEAAFATTQSTAYTVMANRFGGRTTHSHVTSMARTSVSQSPVKTPQVQEVTTQPDVNGPMHVDGGESLNLQRDITNSHIHDSDILEAASKSGSLNMALHSTLPVLSGEIFDQELMKNCNSNDLQMLEENSLLNFYPAEANVAVQRGILSSGKSPGVQTATLQTGSPDQLKGSNVTSMYMRKSPTTKPGGGGGNMLFVSGLPLPKLLTESMQKVVKPLPGSAKDVEGSVKVARRNQGSLHTNLLSHNTGTSYSKSPPLGYDTVQGASSVLTPPKSPVRFSPGETISMSLPKPQSPRTKSPHIHVSPAPINPPALTHSNMPIPTSNNSITLTRTFEPSVPNDHSDHNGPDIQKPETVPPCDSLNNGPPSAQGNVDSVHVQSWNGANTQTSGQQQSTCEQISVETNLARAEPTMASVSGADTSVSESNTFTSDVTVSASTVQQESSAIQTSKAEQCGAQQHTGFSEHSEVEEGEDLCKANLSCPSQSSIMHPTSSVETQPACVGTVTETCTVVSRNAASVSVVQVENQSSQSVQDSTGFHEDQLQAKASSGNPGQLSSAGDVPQVGQCVNTAHEASKDVALTTPSLEENSAVGNVLTTSAAAVVVTASNTGNPPTDPITVPTQMKQCTNVPIQESIPSPVAPVVDHLTGLPEKNELKETPIETVPVTEEPHLMEEGMKSKSEIHSDIAPEVSLPQPQSAGAALEIQEAAYVQQSVPEVPPIALPVQHPAQGAAAANIPESTELSTPTCNIESVPEMETNEVQDAAVEAGQLSINDSLPDGVLDHPPPLVASTNSVDGDVAVSSQEEDTQKPHRATRKSTEAELPPITKTLRGGKQIEAEAPRASRATKMPKRKEEDNGTKASPESESNPQGRQRRSRRRLTESEGNASDHSTAKRSRADGVEDMHTEHADQDGALIDGESNDSASCDHNDIGESTDHPGAEGAPVDNAHPDITAKNVNDDKSGTRQNKDTRRGSDASKPMLRESKRDVKQNVTITGKASERVLRANEEEHVTRSSRRNRQSPSGVLDKTPASRDRSPVSRTRNRTPDQREESPDQQYKRTTRSTKPKEHPEPVTTNRRRRTSRDHR